MEAEGRKEPLKLHNTLGVGNVSGKIDENTT